MIFWSGQPCFWAKKNWLFCSTPRLLSAVSAAWERRHPDPLLPLPLLRISTIARSDAVVFCFGAALFPLIVYLPLYLQLGRGIGVVWAHSGGFRIRPAIVASNACPCRAGPAPLPLQRLPASTDAGWNAAPHVRRRSLSRRWHVSGPRCAVQALAP